MSVVTSESALSVVPGQITAAHHRAECVEWRAGDMGDMTGVAITHNVSDVLSIGNRVMVMCPPGYLADDEAIPDLADAETDNPPCVTEFLYRSVPRPFARILVALKSDCTQAGMQDAYAMAHMDEIRTFVPTYLKIEPDVANEMVADFYSQRLISLASLQKLAALAKHFGIIQSTPYDLSALLVAKDIG